MSRCALPLAALLLASCTTVGPDFHTPASPSASAGYAMAGDPTAATPARLGDGETAAGPWWKAFASPKLDALVDQALAGNPTLQAADAALARAQALELAERGGRLPEIDLDAGARRERINTASFGIAGFPSPTINLYSVGSSVSFDPDLFGGEKRRIENAAANSEAQARRTDAAYLTLTGNVVATAIELASIRAQLAELDDIIAGDRQTLDMIRRGVAAGGAPEAATNTYQAQLAEDEARRPVLQKRLDATRHALALLVGKAPADWTAPEIDLGELTLPASLPVRLPSHLLRSRPDILAAEAEAHAATAAIGVAQAARYPSLSLDASFVLTALHPDDLFKYDSSGWSAGPSLTAPLFKGGSLKARQQAAEAATREADAQYRRTVLAAFGQVADLLSALSHDQDLIAAQTRASDAANENARLTTIAYQNGAGSLLSVIDAQRQAQRTRLAALDAQAQLRSDIAALYVATAAAWKP